MVLDRTYAHALGAAYICKTGVDLFRRHKWQDVVHFASANGIIWIYYGKSAVIKDEARSRAWHMFLHVVSTVAWTLYVL